MNTPDGSSQHFPVVFQFVFLSLLFVVMTSFADSLSAQPAGFNYDESKVPKYELPELLVAKDGSAIETAEQWNETRRPEIMELFREHVYGYPLAPDIEVTFEEVESAPQALDGLAIRRQVKIVCSRNERKHEITMLIYLPANSEEDAGPVPLFVGLNFMGNHTVHPDPEIILPTTWVRNKEDLQVTENKANEDSRGKRAGRWPIESILKRGYGLATIYYGDIDPDFDDGFRNGIHSLFDNDELITGLITSIDAWAWGLSRAMDYFESDEDINHEQVALLGHSRLGKTTLWAGASDPRFSIVISNNSGCGGAAISRRAFGETVKRINNVFPHWFCKKYLEYNDNENACPIDQHMLVAAIAPRPVYIASASKDLWADPRGEFLAGFHAGPAYRLFGLNGLPSDEMPEVDTSVGESIGYHIRTGKHDVKKFDWDCFMNFADKHFGQE